MRVLFVSSEVSPFAKTGGLADVALALPRELARQGIEILVTMPMYRMVGDKARWARLGSCEVTVAAEQRECAVYRGTLPDSNVAIYFLAHDPYFDRDQIYGGQSEYPDALERFTFLSRGALALCDLLGFAPDIIHGNDWHTALIPGMVRHEQVTRFAKTRTILTIHNLGYQGVFPLAQAAVTGLSDQDLAQYRQGDHLNLLKGGIACADLINTVSPTYAEEILLNGAGLETALQARRDDLFGVLNGIDVNEWNPQTDPHLWATYGRDDRSGKALNKAGLQRECRLTVDAAPPLIGAVSRLAEQKGFDLIAGAFDRMMALDVQFVLLGTGESRYESFFRDVQQRYAGRVASMLTFSEAWAHRIEAAADLFVMPSRYEPCGLNQQYSLRYGTVPVVRATGGLKDTVSEYDPQAGVGNGFLFEQTTPDAFLAAVQRAVDVYRGNPPAWQGLVERGMSQDLSWRSSARDYVRLYERVLG